MKPARLLLKLQPSIGRKKESTGMDTQKSKVIIA